MEYDFVISLKQPNYRFVDQVSQLMYIFAIIIFSYFFYTGAGKELFYPVLVFILVVNWVFTRIRLKKNGFTLYRLGLLLAALGFFFGPVTNWWLGALYAAAGLIERYVKTGTEIGFATNEIAFNSFPKKKMQWEQLNNVIIKDGLITIDRKDNKLLQKEIEGDVPPMLEKEFNEFCRQNLLKSNERVAPAE